jgi:hypothetical protein
MARAKRHFLPGHVWHLTHRCHKKEFLLKLVKDRHRWLYWLFQAKKRYGWIHSGYNEIRRPRQRYGIIDFKNLMALLQIENFADLKQAHREWIEEAIKKSESVRESKWTQSIAVGDKSFLKQIKDSLGFRAKGRKILEAEDEYHLREGQAVYGDWRNSDTENKFNWKLAN